MPDHRFPNGTVSVTLHKRKRLTLVADRDDIDELLAERIEALQHENRILRRKVSEAMGLLRSWSTENDLNSADYIALYEHRDSFLASSRAEPTQGEARCPTCDVPHMPGQTRPQSFSCTDPWHRPSRVEGEQP